MSGPCRRDGVSDLHIYADVVYSRRGFPREREAFFFLPFSSSSSPPPLSSFTWRGRRRYFRGHVTRRTPSSLNYATTSRVASHRPDIAHPHYGLFINRRTGVSRRFLLLTYRAGRAGTPRAVASRDLYVYISRSYIRARVTVFFCFRISVKYVYS